MLKTLGAVHIYIYIVRFNKKENINIDNKMKLCVLEEPKTCGFFWAKTNQNKQKTTKRYGLF